MKMKLNSAALPAFFLLLSGILTLLSGCYYDNEEELYKNINAQNCDTTGVTYTSAIVPILNQYCNNCHSTQSASGNVILDTYSGVQSVAASGKLWGSASWLAGFSPMPQGGNQLTGCDLKKIKVWLNQGYPEN